MKDSKGNQLPMSKMGRTTPADAAELLCQIEGRAKRRAKMKRDAEALRLKDDAYRQSWHDG